MSDAMPNVVSDASAQCFIDFEFQVPYFEQLMNSAKIQECIAQPMTAFLKEMDAKSHLSIKDIKILQLCRTPESNYIKCKGWFPCLDLRRQIYVDTMNKIHRQKILSKRLIDVVMGDTPDVNARRPRITVHQLKISWSNEHIIDESGAILRATESFEHWNANNNNNNNGNDNDDNTNESDDDDEEREMNLRRNTTIIRHPTVDSTTDNNTTITNDDDDDDDDIPQSQIVDEQTFVRLPERRESMSGSNSETVYAMERVMDDEEESPNPEEKNDAKTDDLETVEESADSSSVDLSDDDDEEDYILPVPKKFVPIANKHHVTDLASQLSRTKTELTLLKGQHVEDMTHLKNRIAILKKQELSARSRELSVRIDEEYVLKQIKNENDDHIRQMEDALSKANNDTNRELQRAQTKHEGELNRLKSKLKQSTSVYNLDVDNTRKQHRLEITQLKSQVRALQSALDRESQKDHKIQSLTQQLESEKLQTSNMNMEYEQVIEKMSKEYESEMQQEINKRIKDNNQMRREISDLKNTVQQQKSSKLNAEKEVRNNKQELQQLQISYVMVKNLLRKEQQKNLSLEKRVIKLRKKLKNIHQATAARRNSTQSVANTAGNTSTVTDDGKDGHHRVRSLQTRKNSVTIVDEGTQSVIVVTKMVPTLEHTCSVDYGTDDDYHSDHFDDGSADVSNTFLSQESLQRLSLKDREINGLKEKVSRLEEQMRELRKTHTDYTATLQQKIGSLQEAAAMEHENFMKQKQMLEYKSRTQKRETMDARMRKIMKAHKNEMKSKNKEISALKEDCADKKAQIESLNQNIMFLEQQVQQLSIYQEEVNACEYELANYEDEYNALILQIDDHRQKLDVKELELMEIKNNINRKEVENANLHNVVHKHKETITKMEELVQKMRLEEKQMETKANEAQKLQSQLAYITSTRGNNAAGDNNDNDNDSSSNNIDNDNDDNNDAIPTMVGLNTSYVSSDSSFFGTPLAHISEDADDEGTNAGVFQYDTENPPELGARKSIEYEEKNNEVLKDMEMEMQAGVDVQAIEEEHQRQMNEMEDKYIAQVQALEQEKREISESKSQLENKTLEMKNEFSLLEAAHVRLEVEVEQMNDNTLCMERIKIQTISTFAIEMDRLRNQIRAQNQTLQRVFDKRQERKLSRK